VQRQPDTVEALLGDVVDVGLGDEVGAPLLVELLHRRLAQARAVEHLLHRALGAAVAGLHHVAFLQQPAPEVHALQQHLTVLGIHNFRAFGAQ